MKKNLSKPIIGILLGDATGIGPEIVAKACSIEEIFSYCIPVIICDQRVFKLGLAVAKRNLEFQIIKSLSDFIQDDVIQIVDLKNLDPNEIKFGTINPISGKATGESFDQALAACNRGEIDGLAFAPYNKAALEQGGYDINKLVARNLKISPPIGEITVVKDLWISRATGHISLKNSLRRLNKNSVLNAIRLIYYKMKDAGVSKPKIGIAALNPHAGENGLYGNEELEIIEPGMHAARMEGIDTVGPYSADTIFLRALKGEFNGITTMYHDQGLIATKLIDFYSSITVIGGVSCPIATPAQGTAFDIAGKGIAKANGMMEAIKWVSNSALQKNKS